MINMKNLYMGLVWLLLFLIILIILYTFPVVLEINPILKYSTALILGMLIEYISEYIVNKFYKTKK